MGRRRAKALAAGGTIAFALSLAALGSEVAIHGKQVITWFDLNVYYHAGLLARHDPHALYRWQAQPGDGFTYTPFAAVLFAWLSRLPLVAARWLITAASVTALLVTVWRTTVALGWSPRTRAGGVLALAAGLLWLEPVLKALRLGQVELILMAAVVWDLSRPDESRLTGVAIGLAAGIKLVPLIFIPYLALRGDRRAAARAAAAFAITVVVGFVALPAESGIWWLKGYLLHASRELNVGMFANQSLLGLLSRLMVGVRAATPAWVACCSLVLPIGLLIAARLHRNGDPVLGWCVCALTGLLVSPISWDHHWVWVVPLLVYGVHQSVVRRGRTRLLATAGTGLVTAIYFGWPRTLTGRGALVPGRGLIGLLERSSPGKLNPYRLSVGQLFAWDLFVLTGAALLLLAGLAAFKDGIRIRGPAGEWRSRPLLDLAPPAISHRERVSP